MLAKKLNNAVFLSLLLDYLQRPHEPATEVQWALFGDLPEDTGQRGWVFPVITNKWKDPLSFI